MLAFLFGASQLCGMRYDPSSVLEENNSDDEVEDSKPFSSMFLDCIKYIKSVK